MTWKAAVRASFKSRGRRHILVAVIGGAVCGILNALDYTAIRGVMVGAALTVLLLIINVGEDARRLRKTRATEEAARVSD